MERFISRGNDFDQIEYQRLRNDKEWLSIVEFISRDYWHVTSWEAWQSIQDEQLINPNLDGRYKTRFGSITEKSFGYANGWISLFDFVTPTEEQVMQQWGNSWDIIVGRAPDQVLLQLERDALSRYIVPSSKADGLYEFGRVPWVEVWYPSPIPAKFILNVYQIASCSGFKFHPKLIQ